MGLFWCSTLHKTCVQQSLTWGSGYGRSLQVTTNTVREDPQETGIDVLSNITLELTPRLQIKSHLLKSSSFLDRRSFSRDIILCSFSFRLCWDRSDWFSFRKASFSIMYSWQWQKHIRWVAEALQGVDRCRTGKNHYWSNNMTQSQQLTCSIS